MSYPEPLAGVPDLPNLSVFRLDEGLTFQLELPIAQTATLRLVAHDPPSFFTDGSLRLEIELADGTQLYGWADNDGAAITCDSEVSLYALEVIRQRAQEVQTCVQQCTAEWWLKRRAMAEALGEGSTKRNDKPREISRSSNT